jgi:hypothetical protein
MRKMTVVVPAVFCLGLAALDLIPSARGVRNNYKSNCSYVGTPYIRTTLYFGLAHTSGTVTDDEWGAFLREQVTPRFPTGLTFWTVSGQWRRSDGSIGHEQAKVLLLVHEETANNRSAVAAIIDRYKQTFQQESVLSETAPICAEF